MGCTAIAPIAVTVVSGELSGKFAEKATEGLLNIFGSFGVELGAGRFEQWRTRRRLRTEALVEHTALADLVELAARRCMADYAETLGARGKVLREIARRSGGFVRETLAEEGELVIEQCTLPNTLLRPAGAELDAEEREQWAECWIELLRPLFEREDRAKFQALLASTANELVDRLPAKLQVLVKQDRLGGTELEGRAYSAIEAHVQGQRMADAAELRELMVDLSVQADEQSAAMLEQIERTPAHFAERVEVRFGLLERSLRRLLADGDGDLGRRYTAMEQRLEELCRAADRPTELMDELLQNGLHSLDEFRRAFWARAETPTFLGPLLDHPDSGMLVRRTFVGREREVKQLVRALSPGGTRVLYWKAEPGSGKTRLALEARRGCDAPGLDGGVHDRPAGDDRGRAAESGQGGWLGHRASPRPLNLGHLREGSRAGSP